MGTACPWVSLFPTLWMQPVLRFCIVFASPRLHTMPPPFVGGSTWVYFWHSFCCLELSTKPPFFNITSQGNSHFLQSLPLIPQGPTSLLLPINLTVVPGQHRPTTSTRFLPWFGHTLWLSYIYYLSIEIANTIEKNECCPA